MPGMAWGLDGALWPRWSAFFSLGWKRRGMPVVAGAAFGLGELEAFSGQVLPNIRQGRSCTISTSKARDGAAQKLVAGSLPTGGFYPPDGDII